MALIEIRDIAKMQLLGTAHRGPYSEIGTAFERLFNHPEAEHGTTGFGVALYHDNPSRVAQENLRSHACIKLEAAREAPTGFEIINLPALKAAVYTHRGPYNLLPDAWEKMRSELNQSDVTFSTDAPCFEIYVNNVMTTPPSDVLTELCVPIGSG